MSQTPKDNVEGTVLIDNLEKQIADLLGKINDHIQKNGFSRKLKSRSAKQTVKSYSKICKRECQK